KEPGAQVVVSVVVEPDQTLGALGIGEEPGAESVLYLPLLLAGGKGRLLVDDSLLAVAVVDGVVDDRRFHVESELQEPGPVGACGAVLGGRADRLLGGVACVDAPDRVLF